MEKSRATILIVDDDDRNRKLLEVFARNDGYDTVSAQNGKEALEFAARLCPALILLDLMMPGMDGFEVMSWLKQDPATRDIPVIVVSALDDRASQQRILACGADDFISKPAERWELSLRISKLLKNG
jgi:CheY-like chemotaxis protein